MNQRTVRKSERDRVRKFALNRATDVKKGWLAPVHAAA